MLANHSFVDPLVQNARAAEIKIIKLATVMKGLNSGVQDIVPLLATGAIFITYRYGKHFYCVVAAQTSTDPNISTPTHY